MKRLLVLLLPLIFTLSSIAQGQGQGRDGTSGVAAATIRGAASNPAGVSCAPESTGAVAVRVYSGGFYICSGGVYVAVSGGGGTTINSTDGALPYRVNSTTFGNSGISSNARSTTYLNVTSAASGSGITLAAEGGANEPLILAGKGSSGVAIGASDVVLQRDAANTLAQRNGTNAQTLRIYNTYTDASNYERFAITTTASKVALDTSSAGTGSARLLEIGTRGSAALSFFTNNTDRWQVTSSGHFLAGTDSTYDIGASGANRPRTLYLSGTNSIVAAGHINTGATGYIGFMTRSYIKSPADGVLTLVNNADTDFDRLQFGGATASFPSLQRSGASLKVRLADNSDDAPLTTLTVKTKALTVATLPSAATAGAGARAFVTDANTTFILGVGTTVVGGGSNSVPVYSDGTNWLIG